MAFDQVDVVHGLVQVLVLVVVRMGLEQAVLVIALIQNGLVLAKVDPYWVQFLLGALIVATISLNRWRARPKRLA